MAYDLVSALVRECRTEFTHQEWSDLNWLFDAVRDVFFITDVPTVVAEDFADLLCELVQATGARAGGLAHIIPVMRAAFAQSAASFIQKDPDIHQHCVPEMSQRLRVLLRENRNCEASELISQFGGRIIAAVEPDRRLIKQIECEVSDDDDEVGPYVIEQGVPMPSERDCELIARLETRKSDLLREGGSPEDLAWLQHCLGRARQRLERIRAFNVRIRSRSDANRSLH